MQDYWEGYKSFCYAYYSHSARHATEFRESKLGACFSRPTWCSHFLDVCGAHASTLCLGSECLGLHCPRAGQLVWRRHGQSPSPSPHSIRTTCMQLLPLVEMYCRWELEEDCSNLEALMERFDSVAELESHDLGRSLLFMVRDEEDGLRTYSQRRHGEASPNPNANPFDVVRARLAAVDLAFQALQPQVHIVVVCIQRCAVARKNNFVFGWHFVFCHSSSGYTAALHHFCTPFLIQHRIWWHFRVFLPAPLASHSFSNLCLPSGHCRLSLVVNSLALPPWCPLHACEFHGIIAFRCPPM